MLPKFGAIFSKGIEKAIIMEDKKMNFSKLYDELTRSGLTTVNDFIKWMQAGRFLVILEHRNRALQLNGPERKG